MLAYCYRYRYIIGCLDKGKLLIPAGTQGVIV
jgi:hypothetical protein